MKDFFSLKILDLFKPLFKAFGVEYDKMRLIVKTKLTLDRRKGSESNGGKDTFLQSLILYFVMGFFSSIVLFFKMDEFAGAVSLVKRMLHLKNKQSK